MGILTTTPSSQQSTLALATAAAAVVGVLAGVLLTVGYGEAISALVEERMGKSTGTAGTGSDENGPVESLAKKREGKQRERGEMGKGVEGEGGRGGVEAKRNVKEGIEGCIGNTPLIRIVSYYVACVRVSEGEQDIAWCLLRRGIK